MDQPTVPARRARARALGVAAAAAAVSLLATACTASAGDDTEGSALPGITSSTVDVGYIVVDRGPMQKSSGFAQADYGDAATIERGIRAVVDWVNTNGGAGGRELDAHVISFDASTSSDETVQKLCADLTQDKQVFAAVLDGQYQNSTFPCYHGRNTLMVDLTLAAHDQHQFDQYRDYLWTPSLPEYGAYLRAHLETLEAQGWFEGAESIQLLTAGEEVARRAVDAVAEPWLAERGHTKVRVDFVDSTDLGSIGVTSSAALQAGLASGSDRVLTVGGARILPIALANPLASQYDSVWSMSTLDSPVFVQENDASLVTERRDGMVGLGFNPTADVSTGRGPAFPDPDNPAQQQCVDIVTEAGAAPPLGKDGSVVRENWRAALAYCDATLLLKAGLDGTAGDDSVTAAEFADGVADAGPSLRSASGLGSAWGEGVRAGVTAGRALVWSESCRCFDYTGELVSFATK